MRTRLRIQILHAARALACCYCFFGSAAAQVSPTPPPLGTLVDAGGYRVHLYCTGTGSPAVVVVGGAFSFDWGLVQPEVAKTTQICTYDPSGTAWSNPVPARNLPEPQTLPCADRVGEIHRMLQSGGVRGSYVLVGYSIGGLVARLYTHRYPKEVAGMVIVDHAFLDVGSDAPSQPPVASNSKDSPPVLISSVPIVIGMEDDRNFARLPQQNQAMHAWAMASGSLRPTAETAQECSDELERSTRGNDHPLGDRPLLVVRTAENLPAYERLQSNLMKLSQDSRIVLAAHSSHMVIVDRPDVVVAAILEVVRAVRSGESLH